MIVIFIVALVMFGPKKLPELGKTIGKALTEFKRASNDLRSQFEREMHSVDLEHDSIKQLTEKEHAELQRDINDALQPYAYSDPGHYQADQHETPAATNPTTVDALAAPGGESNGTPAESSDSSVMSRMVAQAAPAARGVEGTVARGSVAASEPEPARVS